jgi:N-dimethylarginine dimethylaminohydrolase
MRIGAVDSDHAVAEHERFIGRLRALGATVETLPFVHGAYDSVFAKDSAILVRRDGLDRALLAHPCCVERRLEQRSRRAALEFRGFSVTPPPPSSLEGGDVVVQRGPLGARAYLGHGFRSSRQSATALERFLDVPVTPLQLRDPSLYHLDMAVAALGPSLLVCEEALTPESMRELERVAGEGRVIRVPVAEARAFALNFVALERDVVLAKGARSFERRLEALGYATHAVSLSQFQLAGGSAACLVARVHSLALVAAPERMVAA